jgi:hypothetical protein
MAPGSGANHYIQNHLCVGLTTTSHLLELATDDAVKPTSNTWTIASDRRFKNNIAPFTEGLELIRMMKDSAVTYELNGLGGGTAGMPGISVIAQDVEQILIKRGTPDADRLRQLMIGNTLKNGTSYNTFNNGPLIYALLNAINELDAKVTALGG